MVDDQKPKNATKTAGAAVKDQASSKKEHVPLPSEAAKIARKPNFKWPWGIGGTLGLSLLIFLIPQILIGLFLTENLADRLDDGDVYLNFGILVIGEALTITLLILILRSKGKKLSDLWFKKPKLKELLYSIPAFGIYFLATIVIFLAVTPFLSQETLEQEQEIGFEAAATSVELIFSFIGLVIIVPILEELLFRGFILKGLTSRMGWFGAAIVSSLIFGLAHLQINVMIDTFILGMAASGLVYMTRNLWPAILLHAMKNGIAFAVVFGYLEV